MDWLRQLVFRFRALLGRRDLETDMAEEMRVHLEIEAEHNREGGILGADAHFAARRQFGGLEQIKEQCRDEYRWTWLEQFSKELCFAVRALMKRRGFTLVAVVTLALGLGATTAIFSAVESILLRPLPFPEASQLVSVRSLVKRETWERRAFSQPDFRDYRARASNSFEAFACFEYEGLNLTDSGEAARIDGERVSHDYFHVLGAKPALGRIFTADEDNAPGLPPLVVLSHDLWHSRFGASAGIIGQQIRLNDVSHTVVGVMPETFRGVNGGAQLWVPTSTLNAQQWNARGSRGREVVARLRPGVTLEQARAELALVGSQLATEHPETNANRNADLAPLRDELVGSVRTPLFVLLGAVGLVLAATCANVANLLLARLATRQREVAIRLAIGATRGALVRLLLAESLVLSLAGGVLSLGVAHALVMGIKRFAPLGLPSFVSVGVHWPAFGFGLALALGCAVAIAGVPAWFVTRDRFSSKLGESGRYTSAVGVRVRAALVSAQVAVSLALLVGSSLLVRSLVELVTQEPGYRTEKLVIQSIALSAARFADGARREFVRTLLERAAALPGVKAAAVVSDAPLGGGSVSATTFMPEGGSPVLTQDRRRVYRHYVSPDFFRTAGIPLLVGETFSAGSSDSAAEPVAVVDERFARRNWPDGDALNRHFILGTGPTEQRFRIIGIAATTKYRGLRDAPTADPDVYIPFSYARSPNFNLILHTATDGRSLGQSVRQLVGRLDPTIPVTGLRTIEDRIAQVSATQRFSAQLLGAFAGAALGLAAIGLYGIVAFGVSQRTRELGVRMALGAAPNDVVRLILGGTSRLVAIGLLGGLALALVLARFIETLLYRVSAHDPLTYVVVAGTLVVVAGIAAWLPARRAAKIDPVVALRSE